MRIHRAALFAVAFAVAFAASGVACRPVPPPSIVPVAEPVAPPTPDVPTEPPVEPPPRLAERIDLPIPGHQPAVVWVPAGRGKRALLVATHGAAGTPEAQCDFWHPLVRDLAFVLCLRGVTVDVYAPPEERSYFYPSHPVLEREIRAALEAITARFGADLDPEGSIYTGFSQGATMGALALSQAPHPFTVLLLMEGGSDAWSAKNARAFHEGGGKSVVFVCGRAVCADPARRSVGILSRAGVDARLTDVSGLPRAGHSMDGPVGKAIRDAFATIVADDPRWTVTP